MNGNYREAIVGGVALIVLATGGGILWRPVRHGGDR